MKGKIFIFLVLFLMSRDSQGQLFNLNKYQAIYGGFDIGIKKDFNTFSKNDNGYFLLPQYKYLDYNFIQGEVYFSGLIGTQLKNRINIEFGFSTHNITNHIIYFIKEIDELRWSNVTSPYIKWTMSVGRDLKLGKRFFIIPFGQVSYILSDLEPDEISGGGSSSHPLFMADYFKTDLSKHHFFLGLRATFQWRFNKFLSINLNYGYNQGLQQSFKTNQVLEITSIPDQKFYAEQISRLSHSTLSLSAYYNFKPNKDYD